mmetsp:Transcript_32194/g.44148  ORF Transcript_32194/g.44148 Transcript_32194/m.44148 type:complete len:242 (-) Transcript_32194:553-1278(-)
MVFKKSTNSPCVGTKGSVQEMHELLFFLIHRFSSPTPNLKISRLIISTIRNRNKFSELTLLFTTLAREPPFQIDFLRGSIIQCTRNNTDQLIRDLEIVKKTSCGLDHPLKFFPRVFWLCDTKLFNLVKLVDPENTTIVFPMSPSFLPETSRIPSVPDRLFQISFINPLSLMKSTKRLFRSGNHISRVLIISSDVIQFFIKLRQLSDFSHHLFLHHIRRLCWNITLLCQISESIVQTGQRNH